MTGGAIEIRSLRVELDGVPLVENFSLTLTPGRVHAVIGASGGGKTVAALAVLGLEPEGAVVTNRPAVREGFSMVLQEPLSALNPVMRVGAQLRETLKVHGQPLTRASELMTEVGLSDERLDAFPHQLSGGQRQRVAIACALAANPRVLIADEPTTALDVATRNTVLALLRTLARQRNLAVWLISHDLDAVRAFADDVTALTPQPLRAPPAAPPAPATGAPVLLRAEKVNVFYGPSHAVRDVSLTVAKGERLGVIGESGSGKSSLARALLGLQAASGRITFDGQPMQGAAPALRRRFQPVFQDVGAALDPRLTIAESLAEPFEIHRLPVGDLPALLRQVQLAPALLERLPRQLSTGQRQRVNLARALALEPELLLLDEPVSALDARVADEVLALLDGLAKTRGLSLLVITHELSVVERLCTKVCVMRAGEVVEEGRVEEVLARPQHPYTQQLAAAHAHVLAQPPSP